MKIICLDRKRVFDLMKCIKEFLHVEYYAGKNIEFKKESKSWRVFKRNVKNKSLVLIGAGKVCSEFLKKYSNKYNVLAIIDNSEKKQGKRLKNIKIISPKELEKVKQDYVLLITNAKYNAELKEQFNNAFSLLDMELNKKKYKLSIRRLKVKQKLSEVKQKLLELKYKVFSPNGIINNYITFHIKAVARICRVPWEYSQYKDLLKFKNKHLGKRAFIVATGPSLKKEDVERLKNEITISMNGIFSIFKNTLWRPTYYLIQDPFALDKYLSIDRNFSLENCSKETTFLSERFKKVVKKTEKIKFIPISYLDHLVFLPSKKLKYSHNLLWGHYCAYTVTNLAINLAEYMGIKEIYLLGVDCNYSLEKQYFDNSKNELAQIGNNAKIMQKNQMRGYEFIKNKLGKKGIKIYNATRGGALEVFERVEFDSLFEEEKNVQ